MLKSRKNLYLFIAAVLIAILPVIFVKNAEFNGADQQAVKAITQIMPDFRPWASPVFQPKSSEMESTLFAIQAALGAGVIGYCLGYLKGRKGKEDEQK